MSRKLAAMLGKTEAEMSNIIGKLEAKSGHQSVDVRLLAEHNLQLRSKIAQLGLDPDDTTHEELQAALVAKYGQDAELVDKALGAAGKTTEQKIQIAINLLEHVVKAAEVWVPKSAVIKSLLKLSPPKKTLKFLNYRSLDSMLKRVDPGEILYIANALDSASWSKNFEHKIAKLRSSDFELRQAKLIKTGVKLPGGDFAVADKNSGTVLINTDNSDPDIPVLSLCLSVLEKLEALSLRSEFENLAKVNPSLRWWADTEHLLAHIEDGQLASLHIKDVAKAHAGQPSTAHAASHLWSQLLSAYKEKIDELPAEISEVSQEVGSQLSTPVRELAIEAVEA